jgi:hypothetical protein
VQRQLEATLRGERICAAVRALVVTSTQAVEGEAKELLATGQEQVAATVTEQLLAAEGRCSRLEVGGGCGWLRGQVPHMILRVVLLDKWSHQCA